MSVFDINPDNISDELIRKRHLWAVIKWSLYRQYDKNFRSIRTLPMFMDAMMTQINYGIIMKCFTLEELAKKGVLVIEWAKYSPWDYRDHPLETIDAQVLFV